VKSRHALSNRQSDGPLIGRRRCIVAALSGVPGLQLGWTSAAAQKVYRIGVLDPNAQASLDTWNEFVTELKRRGYEERKNLVFERRFTDERRNLKTAMGIGLEIPRQLQLRAAKLIR
jgi:hypothetical protein